MLGGRSVRRAIPEAIRIAAGDRDHLLRREVERRPAGHGEERRVDAGRNRKLLQLEDVLGAAPGSVQPVFIFKLRADDGAAVCWNMSPCSCAPIC